MKGTPSAKSLSAMLDKMIAEYHFGRPVVAAFEDPYLVARNHLKDEKISDELYAFLTYRNEQLRGLPPLALLLGFWCKTGPLLDVQVIRPDQEELLTMRQELQVWFVRMTLAKYEESVLT